MTACPDPVGDPRQGTGVHDVGNPVPPFSVAALFDKRDVLRHQKQQAEERLAHRKDEDGEAPRRRLENFQLTDEHIKTTQLRIKHAFERRETELMFATFPSGFCTDDGRAFINAGLPRLQR